MSQNRYRAHLTFSYDIECDKEYDKVLIEIGQELEQRTSGLVVHRKQVRLEKLKQTKHRICVGEFNLDEVLPYISRDERKRKYKINEVEYEVRMDSQRYFVFRDNLKCSACGLEGSKFRLELSPSDKNPHFNLYALEDGRLILMTKDHVQPKSYGGVDIHSNYQTLCAICNNLKGSTNMTLDKIWELRKIYNENINLPRKKLSKLLEDARNVFKLPHLASHIPKKNRKTYLAQLKSKEDAVATNTDLRLWKRNDGSIVGKSVYEKPLEDAIEIASIRIGTLLKPKSNSTSRVVVQLDTGEDCEIYQGYLENVKAN